MKITADSSKPIFIQIAEGLEDAILMGAYPEESQIPSTTEISVTLNVNPATALKGVNLLVEEGNIYKKRGLGMFVSQGAVDRLKKKRKNDFFKQYIISIVEEAKKVDLSLDEIIEMLRRGFEKDD